MARKPPPAPDPNLAICVWRRGAVWIVSLDSLNTQTGQQDTKFEIVDRPDQASAIHDGRQQGRWYFCPVYLIDGPPELIQTVPEKGLDHDQ